jgi:hypothetical protein
VDPAYEDLLQQHRTLQGKWRDQVPTMQRQLAEAQRQLQEQAALLAELKKKPVESKPAEKPEVDKRDVEAFGSDLMDMVQRYLTQHGQALNNQIHTRAAAIEQRLDALEQNVNGVSRRTSQSLEAQFYALLTKLVPDWEEINESDEWKLWLEERDPIYGARRQDALESAHSTNDAQRVANVFSAFKNSRPVPKQPDSLASQVAPTSVASAPAPTQPAPKAFVSEKLITKFFNDVALGRYDKRPQEQARIEAEINSAVAEGRIVR